MGLATCALVCALLGPFGRGTEAAVQEAYLKASNTDGGDQLSIAVAVSGDTAVVGAPEEDSTATGVNGSQASNGAPSSGAAYVFRRSGSTWVQEAYLKASNTDAGDQFGAAVAVSGDTIAVGAYSERSAATGVDGNQADDSAQDAGAVYVFRRSGTTWTQEAYLKASNTDAGDQFGLAVTVAGDTLVVGAPGESSDAQGVNGDQADNTATRAGAAYAFRRTGTTWVQEAYLKGSNTGAPPGFSGDNFGIALASSGDTLIVGAYNEASAATGVNGDEDDNSACGAGAAYVFVRAGSAWSQEAYLKASNTDLGDRFGSSVALSGDTALVGAPFERSGATGVDGDGSDNGARAAGAAYAFRRTGTTWVQEAYLKASNTDPDDRFGVAVAVSGDALAAGAERESSGATGVGGDESDNGAFIAGAAYLFARSGTTWSQDAYLKASNTDAGDGFGNSVALAGGTLLVGARAEASGATGVNGDQDDDGSMGAGAVYAFGLGSPPLVYCTAKTSSAGCVASIGTTDRSGPPVSGAADYSVTAAQVQEGKNGLVFAGISGPAALPFNGGTLCVQPPTKRGPIQSSGGVNPSGCNGAFTTLVNDGSVIPLGLDAGPGGSAWYQYWYRDPAGGAGQLGTALSDGVRLDFQ